MKNSSKLINIGFGNMVSSSRIIAIVSPESAPIKRIIQEAKDRGVLIDATYGRRTRAVIITDSARNEAGLIKQINGPIYQGAVVLCQGADDPQIRLAITEAISKATGLGANQIAVLKMK